MDMAAETEKLRREPRRHNLPIIGKAIGRNGNIFFMSIFAMGFLLH
ncbi:MAG: hypothetical protein JWM56_248 [Candidatus Peribacteria bacterium]|nr:hypothetical protein [Candidatus Peribacteria bacterium]